MMKRAVMILAGGFEEAEAIVPADFLRRCEIYLTLQGLGRRDIKGAHGIIVEAEEVFRGDQELPDAVILPGGSPGAENLAASADVKYFLKKMEKEGKVIAAICASPALVLAPAGILENKKATCYPGLEKNFTTDITHIKENVVVDGQVVTASGPGAAFSFAAKTAEFLVGKEKAGAVSEMMLSA